MTDEIIELYGMLEGDECYAKKKKRHSRDEGIWSVQRDSLSF